MIRVFVKRWLARVTTVIEFCHVCGVRQPLVWHADDDLWSLVADEPLEPYMAGVLCPSCFDKRATALGVSLYWRPDVEFVHGAGV